MAMAVTSYTDREIELLIEEAVNRRMKEIERAIAVPAPAPPAATLIEFAIRPLRDRIEALEEDNDNFRRALGRYAISECGELPHPDLGITYLKCQILVQPVAVAGGAENEEHLEPAALSRCAASPTAGGDQRPDLPDQAVLQDGEEASDADRVDHGGM